MIREGEVGSRADWQALFHPDGIFTGYTRLVMPWRTCRRMN
jgi:hypothetical protein